MDYNLKVYKTEYVESLFGMHLPQIGPLLLDSKEKGMPVCSINGDDLVMGDFKSKYSLLIANDSRGFSPQPEDGHFTGTLQVMDEENCPYYVEFWPAN